MSVEMRFGVAEHCHVDALCLRHVSDGAHGHINIVEEVVSKVSVELLQVLMVLVENDETSTWVARIVVEPQPRDT